MMFNAATAQLNVVEGHHVTSSKHIRACFQLGVYHHTSALLIDLQTGSAGELDARLNTDSDNDMVNGQLLILAEFQDHLVVLATLEGSDRAVGLDIHTH